MAAFATAMIMIGIDRAYGFFVVGGSCLLLAALALAHALARRSPLLVLPAPEPVDESYLLRFFACSDRNSVGQTFSDLAHSLCALPSSPERSVALRKLLEARDAAVRAETFKDGPNG